MNVNEILTVAIAVNGFFAIRLITTLDRLSETATELNQKLAVICARVDTHEGRLTRLEQQT